MSSPKSAWRGLEPEISVKAVYRPFRDLLKRHLPMSQQDLANTLSKDRTTVSRWTAPGAAPLGQQQAVIEAVRDRLHEISEKVDIAERMIRALQGVEVAHQELMREPIMANLDKLDAANDRVRDLL